MIELKNVSFSYGTDGSGAGVKDLCLRISGGETVLICGGSGCGKTTLTRLINGLIPHYYEGCLEGSIRVGSISPAEQELYDMAGTVGSVFQNPRSQFFNVDTTSELAFSCENMGMPEAEVLSRVQRTAEELDLLPLLGRSIFDLSGGEKQKIACGSVSALSPEIYVLDEPTSNLDMEGIAQLRRIMVRWKRQGKTVVIAEHRLHFLRDLADRVVYMEQGRIAGEFNGADFFEKPRDFFRERGLRAADLSRIDPDAAPVSEPKAYFKLKQFHFEYMKGQPILDIPSLKLPAGAVIAVVGRNGAGKTTLMRSICGLLKKDRGILCISGRTLTAKKRLAHCYMVMQDVNHQLFTESVLDEVLLSMDREDESAAMDILERLDLLAYKELHPMSLSGGQKQRVAIASALASGRELVVFDEPTSGLDARHMEWVAVGIREMAKAGKTSLIVTHDPELIAACCSHVLHLADGQAVDSYSLDGDGWRKLKDFFNVKGR